jgi:hypothetical protein
MSKSVPTVPRAAQQVLGQCLDPALLLQAAHDAADALIAAGRPAFSAALSWEAHEDLSNKIYAALAATAPALAADFHQFTESCDETRFLCQEVYFGLGLEIGRALGGAR